MEGDNSMSKEIDTKVLEMRFDSSKFDKKANKTISKIDTLQEKLDELSSNKNKNDISEKLNDVDVSVLNKALDSVSLKFSVMEMVAMSAINNITTAVMNSAKEIVKSMLSIDSMEEGYDSYTSKLTSMRTLENIYNTEQFGNMTYDEIEGSLDKLQWYADETSLSFENMVATISSFGVAGIELETAVSSLEGFGNWISSAGGDAAAVNGVLDNLSSLMTTGYLSGQQWMSLSKFKTPEFMQIAKDIALAQGTLTKTASGYSTNTSNKKVKSSATINNDTEFATSLSSGWFTSDVFAETMKVYSMYTDQVYEMLDDYEQTSDAMAALSAELAANNDKSMEISEKGFNSAQKAKTFEDAIASIGAANRNSWAQTYQIVIGNVAESEKLWTDVANKLWYMFASGGESRNSLLTEWAELGGRSSLIQAIYDLIDGIQSRLDIVKETWQAIFPPATADVIKNITDSIASFAADFNDLDPEKVEIVKDILRGLFSIIKTSWTIVKGMVQVLKPILGLFSDIFWRFAKILAKASNAISKVLSGFTNETNEVGESVDEIVAKVSPLQAVFNGLTSVFEGLRKGFSGVGQIFFKLLDIVKNSFLGIKKSFISGEVSIENIINGFISFLTGVAIYNLTVAIKDIGETFSSLGDSFWATFTKEISEAMRNVAITLLLFATALAVLCSLDPDKVSKSLATLSVALVEFMGSIFLLLKFFKGTEHGIKGMFSAFSDSIRMQTIAGMLIQLSVSLLIISVAMSILANLDTKSLAKGVVTIAAVLTIMVLFMKYLSEPSCILSEKKIKIATNALIKISIGLLILSKALSSIGSMSTSELIKSLIGIAISLTIVTAFIKSISNQRDIKNLTKASFAIIMISMSLIIMAKAIKKIGLLDLSELGKGLLGIAGILAIIFIFAEFMMSVPAKHLIGISLALSLLSVAILIISKAFENLGSIEFGRLMGNLLALTLLLGVIFLFSVFMSTVPIMKLLGATTVLTFMALALIALSMPLISLSKIPFKKLQKALISLMLTMAVMMGFFMAASSIEAGKMIAIAAAFIIMGMAMQVFAVAMMTLGALDIKTMAKALGGLVVTLLIFIGVGLALSLLSPILLVVVACLASLGLVCFAISAALLRFVVTLGILATMSTAMLAAISTAVDQIVDLFIGLIPKIVKAVGAFLAALFEVLANYGPQIIDSILTLLYELMDALIVAVPKIVDKLGLFIIAVLNQLGTFVGQAVEAILSFFISMFKGVANAIETKGTEFLDSIYKIKEAFLNFILLAFEKKNDMKEKYQAIGSAVIDAIFDGLEASVDNAKDTVTHVFKRLLNLIQKVLGINSPSKETYAMGEYLMEGLANGLKDEASSTEDIAKEETKGVLNSMSGMLTNIADSLMDGSTDFVIKPVLDTSGIETGLSSMGSLFKNSGLNLGTSMDLTSSISGTMSKMTTNESAIENLVDKISGSGSTTTITNTFNIQNDDPQSVAEQVADIIQHEYQGEESVWAR